MQVTVYEAGSKVGGLWVYENDSGLSPVTAYSDFPFPKGSPFYLNHWQVHRYLEGYTDHFDLRRHIRFNSKVVSLTSKWRVTLENGTEELFDGVVVATGHQGVPEPLRGKRVLVVRMGNSAVDIAGDTCTLTASTTLAARSPASTTE